MGPVARVGPSSHVGSFGRIELCDCVSTLGSFGRVGPVGHVGSSGHVEQFGRVEPSSLVGLFCLVPTLKGWFGCLAAYVGNGLSRLHGRFPVLIDSLNQCKLPVV